ncbi:MAG: Holliday junction branch migration protein RuvA [Eubacteriales bacterium]|nr:Holliday junction branch migration protein RuvA [Eubacteriales bacterium]
MIGFIKGIVDSMEIDSVLIDNHGIGWQVYVPTRILERELQKGDTVKLYTYMAVREDAMTLYGFLTREDKEIFQMVLNVSGIGPKGALGILSAMTADDLRFAVLSEDAAAIAKAPGIGKKTAQKLILELKDKFDYREVIESRLDAGEAKAAAKADSGPRTAENDAVEALVSLGYSGAEALQAVRKVDADPTMSSEDILKAALKFIF